MLKLAGELLEGQFADHTARLDAHTTNYFSTPKVGEYTTLNLAAGNGSAAMGANILYAVPIHLVRPMTFDRIACHVTGAGAAGKKARMGVYTNVGFYPTVRSLDSGEVAVDGTGIKAATISLSLLAGWHWLIWTTDGTPTIAKYADRPFNSYPLGLKSTDFTDQNHYYSKTETFAALPTPYPASATMVGRSSATPIIALRVASLD
jgi:hypothetical protein